MKEPFISRREAFYLCAIGCLIGLIVLFYVEENWRGKHEWERTRKMLEAGGAHLDWASQIPAPIPDEQNVFGVPEMQQWFVRNFTGIITPGSAPMRITAEPPASWPLRKTNRELVVLSEIRVALPGIAAEAAQTNRVVEFGDQKFREDFASELRNAVGSRAIGVTGSSFFFSSSAQQSEPRRLLIQSDTNVSLAALRGFLPKNALGKFQLEPRGSNLFRVSLGLQAVSAQDYLAWSAQFEPDFELMRQALERPRARMGGSYQNSTTMPIPNFITLRIVVQSLAQRAQCHLLVGQPGEALRDLTLIHDLCRLLEARPTTLVAAMIEVAVTGLYASTVADGLRLEGWHEPQLAAIQQELVQMNLLVVFRRSLETDRAAVCRFLETTSAGGIGKQLSAGAAGTSPLDVLGDLAPRGWFYQNMANVARFDQIVIESVDPANRLVSPAKANTVSRQMQSRLARFSPYSALARIAVPIYLRTPMTVALNQTMVSEALIACALERYRLVHQQFPQSLQQLVPQFLKELPHDVIGGQPIHYHRTTNDRFVLYCVGWNQIDDGGVTGATTAEGDWVWQ